MSTLIEAATKEFTDKYQWGKLVSFEGSIFDPVRLFPAQCTACKFCSSGLCTAGARRTRIPVNVCHLYDPGDNIDTATYRTVYNALKHYNRAKGAPHLVLPDSASVFKDEDLARELRNRGYAGTLERKVTLSV